MALRPYYQLVKMSLDRCAICGQPLQRKGGWKKMKKDGKEVKVCSTHPTPDEE